MNLRTPVCGALAALVLGVSAKAGDGFGGTNRYELDLSAPSTNHVITAKDRKWAESLRKNTGTKESPIYFTKTTLTLKRDGKVVDEPVYQRVDEPRWFFIPDGNVMLNLEKGTGYYAGCDWYAPHRPRSKTIVVFFKLLDGGLKLDTPHSEFKKGPVWWTADPRIGGMVSE